jgi:hypothetical protein
VSQGPSFIEASGVAGPHQEDVALPHGHFLTALRLLEVAGEDAVARLQPVHSARSRDVEQDPAPDQPVLQRLDRLDGRAGGRDRVGGPAVVEPSVVGDMAEGVEVAVRVVVVVDADVVLDKGEAMRVAAVDIVMR